MMRPIALPRPAPPMELGERELLSGSLVGLDVTAVVETLSDGDTVTVRSGSRRLRVRLLGIDAPELHFHGTSQSPWGEAALRYLRLFVAPGAQVRLVTDRQVFDQYGRLLAYVFRSSRNLNLDMVRAGWAVEYLIYPNLRFMQEIQAATAQAEAAGRGIFDRRRPLPLLPYEFRQAIEHRAPVKFCGDSRTRRYYPPVEYQRVPAAWRTFFLTEADAHAAGYAPAAVAGLAAREAVPALTAPVGGRDGRSALPHLASTPGGLPRVERRLPIGARELRGSA